MGEFIKRKPLTALILSLLTTGLGQLYNGQLKRAALLYFLGLLIVVLLSFFGLFFSFIGIIIWFATLLGYTIFVLIDAFINARRLHTIKAKKYNKWYLYLLIILINAFVVNPLLAPFIIPTIKAYKLPAASMTPTLMIGDHIIVNKEYYTDKNPERGDVVIFPSPIDPRKDYIKRVIGLPGETIEMVARKVYINGQPLEEPYIMGASETGLSPTMANIDKSASITIPDGKLFVLGDNRDSSQDSRYFGFIDRGALKGKALYIYWSNDKRRIGKNIK